MLALIVAIALSLVTPAVVKAALPVGSLRIFNRPQYIEFVGTLALYAWTAVFVALGLLGPGADRHGRCREFGPAALVAVIAAFLLKVGQVGVMTLLYAGVIGWPTSLYEHYWFMLPLEHGSELCAAAVLGVWMVLAISGAGRRPAGWFSWASCGLGGAWILWSILVPIIYRVPIPWLRQNGIP